MTALSPAGSRAVPGRGARPDPGLAGRLAAVEAQLAALDGVLVAYSGGVDSAVLAAIAVRVLGPRAVACTAVSQVVPHAEVAAAVRLAGELGIRHRLVHTRELGSEAFVANPPDRCYVCKGLLLGELRRVADEEGAAAIAFGENADDLLAVRPGRRAMTEDGAIAPLAEAGLRKADVREIARLLGLPVADKPASPCLASRIPYGERITPDRLGRIGTAEALLHRLGFPVVRVRDHHPVARVEVPVDELPRLLEPAVRRAVEDELRSLGWAHVTADLGGFVSGSFDRALRAAPGEAPAAAEPGGR